MSTLETLCWLNEALLCEMPEYRAQAAQFPRQVLPQQRLFRSLMNLRPPMPVKDEFLAVQDAYLAQATQQKGVVHLDDLQEMQPNCYLWQGDITRLAVDGIVNAANDALLGCFVPCHACIDNAIHSAAGVQLRLACDTLMKAQGHREPTGQAKITAAYHLPCQWVIHTVGPIVRGALTQTDCELLRQCYQSCLSLAVKQGLHSIAFCCISTGEFGFPNQEACQIALRTVQEFLAIPNNEIKVIFNVFKDQDYQLYQRQLG